MASKKTTTVATAYATNAGKDDTNYDDNACVVCFKNVEIYSIGDCDHPVCYECSTRMRVLCQQNECPICRHVLLKVLFTYEKMPYRELEANNRTELYSKKYRIGFCNAAIQQRFFELLDHPCPKCNLQSYRTFQGLRHHVYKEHNLYYCDLCTENLKIFTFERRCYTQNELNIHRTKGDVDNRSHRGHPLCEYCNKRYLDRDELFRHLRRDHYFCHFCDADGCNEFYKDYAALAEHFRRDHFLCEEGKCASEQFVGAFRTEIDYKAHVANVHSKSLNKQQAKQTRTLQLEITLGPSGRVGQSEQSITNIHTRNDNMEHENINELSTASGSGTQRQRITIDTGNEEEFPSLCGMVPINNVSLVRPPPPSMRNYNISGLARTKENFPELGSCGGGNANDGGGEVSTNQRLNNQGMPVAAILKKGAPTSTSRASTKNVLVNGMVIHVSNRPTVIPSVASSNKKPTLDEFPALSMSKSKKNVRNLHEDMLPSSSSAAVISNVAAKHRTLVDDYVSVANPSNFQKMQITQKEELEAKTRSEANKNAAPKLTTADFPTLGKPQSNSISNSSMWIKSNVKKQRELENSKTKIAPAPVLPNNNKNNSNAKTNNNVSNQEQKVKKQKKQKDKKINQENMPFNSTVSTTTKNTTKQKEKNNNEQKLQSKSSSMNLLLNENSNETLTSVRAPPGFRDADSAKIKPPPGFISNVTVNSIAKLPNNLTFTSSLGESYCIVPSAHTYTAPPDAASRNQKLVNRFHELLKTPEALDEFRLISQKFREGVVKTQAYYEHCQAALHKKFDQVFPELLTLLPDITKQQELYLAHKQHLNSLTASHRKSLPHLEVCNTCKQVLLGSDLDAHKKLHELKNNFPSLNSSNSSAIKSKNVQNK